MADDIPMFPKASSLFIHSGNILNWDRLKKNPTQTPREEIAECCKGTLAAFFSAADKTELQYITDLVCVHSKFKEILPEEDRNDLKLTVKIFLYSDHPASAVREAVEHVQTELGVSFIETVLIAVPDLEDEEMTLEHVKPYWEVLQELCKEETVLSAGVSDFDCELLEQLYEWAEMKPKINQVNLESCCVMPPDLIKFAKETDIQLLTHNDPKDILPAKTLQSVISVNSTEQDGEKWQPQWMVCYSVLVKCRGIIKIKGYMVKAKRKNDIFKK